MRLVLLMVGFFIVTIAYPQNPPMPGDDQGDFNCVYKNKYSASQRLAFYPFNKSASIKIVSFRYNMNNLAVQKDTLLLDSLIEVRELDKDQTKSLTDIVYNNFYKRRSSISTTSLCFWPRHAILFYDQQGKLFESVLICFHCSRYELSSKEINFGEDCDQKLEKLLLFFRKTGIKFGLDDEPLFYPGEKYKDEGVKDGAGN